MVKQGTIIKINFNPSKGHEQSGYRLAVVISNDEFNKISSLAILLPIISKDKNYPLDIPLDNRTSTQGVILCAHIKAMDLSERHYKEVEMLPKDLLEKVINYVNAEIEIL